MGNFPAYGKTARLAKTIYISEKIDGTNGLIEIQRFSFGTAAVFGDPAAGHAEQPKNLAVVGSSEETDETGMPLYEYWVKAGSRNRYLVPKTADNAGFGQWVHENARALAFTLGSGRHYGEWWGQGIQRGYSMDRKLFSLFNTGRWNPADLAAVDGLSVVPTLLISTGDRINKSADAAIKMLTDNGSYAAPGFMRPEGINIYHSQADVNFKRLIENDDISKTEAALNVRPERDLFAGIQIGHGNTQSNSFVSGNA